MSDFETRERAARQKMEELRRKWQEKNHQRIAAHTAIENAEREMNEILEEVRERFEVKDIAALRDLYLKSLETNEATVAQLQESLDACEASQQQLKEELG